MQTHDDCCSPPTKSHDVLRFFVLHCEWILAANERGISNTLPIGSLFITALCLSYPLLCMRQVMSTVWMLNFQLGWRLPIGISFTFSEHSTRRKYGISFEIDTWECHNIIRHLKLGVLFKNSSRKECVCVLYLELAIAKWPIVGAYHLEFRYAFDNTLVQKNFRATRTQTHNRHLIRLGWLWPSFWCWAHFSHSISIKM